MSLPLGAPHMSGPLGVWTHLWAPIPPAQPRTQGQRPAAQQEMKSCLQQGPDNAYCGTRRRLLADFGLDSSRITIPAWSNAGASTSSTSFHQMHAFLTCAWRQALSERTVPNYEHRAITSVAIAILRRNVQPAQLTLAHCRHPKVEPSPTQSGCCAAGETLPVSMHSISTKSTENSAIEVQDRRCACDTHSCPR